MVEEVGHGTEVEGAYSQRDAPDVRVCRALGTFNDRRNPMKIVRVKDSSKRRQRLTVLTVEEYEVILGLLKEPYRTMAIVALQWDDFDFEKNQLLVQRSIVSGQVDDVNTECSRDHVPLHDALDEVLLEWSREAMPTEDGWVFASPLTNSPYLSSWLDETGAPMKCSRN